MFGNFLLILSVFLLGACNPNKLTSEPAKNSKTISIEQQEHDALVILEAENALLVSAQAESIQTESLLLRGVELEAEHKNHLLTALAKRKRIEVEQELIESAKLESDKAKELLNQGSKVKKLPQTKDIN